MRGYIDFDSDPWPLISESAKDLIRKMLCMKPSERLTAHEVLCMSLFSYIIIVTIGFFFNMVCVSLAVLNFCLYVHSITSIVPFVVMLILTK